MKDLKIKYTENGVLKEREYDLIFNFTDEIENNNSFLQITNISAIFFENDLTTKNFQTIQELYEHCKNILK